LVVVVALPIQWPVDCLVDQVVVLVVLAKLRLL
jgi:hypothetical protein